MNTAPTQQDVPIPVPSALPRVAIALAVVSVLIIPVNFLIITLDDEFLWVFMLLAVLQTLTGFGGAICALVEVIRRGRTGDRVGGMVAIVVVGGLVGLGGPVALGLLWLLASAMGGAWGRPLRVRGRILHPELRAGSDWTRGARPGVVGLDAATRAALEALWLHDAQKEHASVPAFSRISWQLAAVGAPADLVIGAHRAAMEEIDHAQRCFALAAGYGGRPHSVEAMPDLLVGGLDVKGDPLVHLALESLKDGCLLEDFNADVAAVCAEACEEPATRDVLERIAREERSHADFSWRMLAWLVERGGERVRRATAKAGDELARVARPTAVSGGKHALVAKADPAKLRAHGRIEDATWARLWDERLTATQARVQELLEPRQQEVAA